MRSLALALVLGVVGCCSSPERPQGRPANDAAADLAHERLRYDRVGEPELVLPRGYVARVFDLLEAWQRYAEALEGR